MYVNPLSATSFPGSNSRDAFKADSASSNRPISTSVAPRPLNALATSTLLYKDQSLKQHLHRQTMNTICRFLLIFCFPCVVLGDTNTALFISYESFGEVVDVRNGQLEYWWRPQRAQDDNNYSAVTRHSTASNDNHQMNAQLTPE
jgi:hypothetical protein